MLTNRLRIENKGFQPVVCFSGITQKSLHVPLTLLVPVPDEGYFASFATRAS